MPILKENFNVEIFLYDIHFQCQLFDHSYRRLEVAAKHWIDLSKGIDDGIKFPPLEIISECTVCLSAMSAIRRILMPRGKNLKQNTKKRGAAIYNFLGNPDISNISSSEVRNAWEHHDEKLDGILSARQIGKTSISELYISPTPPSEGTIIIRRFDPVGMSIYFSGTFIPLKLCNNEIQLLDELVKASYSKLGEEVVEV